MKKIVEKDPKGKTSRLRRVSTSNTQLGLKKKIYVNVSLNKFEIL
jgi:hypothetical protein